MADQNCMFSLRLCGELKSVDCDHSQYKLPIRQMNYGGNMEELCWKKGH